MLYSYGFVDRKLSPNYIEGHIENNEIVITCCSNEIYQFLLKKVGLSGNVFRLTFKEKVMNSKEIEQVAIDHPDDAEHVLLETGRPDKADIEYLRFLLSKMQGKEDRTIEDSWRNEFKGRVENYSFDTQEIIKGEAFSEPPPEEEPTHGFHQEQGQRETADPAPEYPQESV